MNLAAALKAIAPAVGDGRIVPQHAYIDVENLDMGGAVVRANNGNMSVEASVDHAVPRFCVPHNALIKSLERQDATLIKSADDCSLVSRAGRSRVTLRCLMDNSFPTEMSFTPLGDPHQPGEGFKTILKDLGKFTAGSDGHIWQMGVHFCENFAFAFGPFAAIFHETASPFDLSLPPWAAEFILAQEAIPTLQNGTSTFRAQWDGMRMTSTRLIEEYPDNVHTFIEGVPRNGGVPVPDNLKEIVERLKAYDVKRFKLADGKITHTSELLDIEEEVDIDAPARTWGTAQMLAALEHAETISLTGERAIWHGNGYHGIFAGMIG